MTDQRRVSYFYDAEVGNYHYGQGEFGCASLDAHHWQLDGYHNRLIYPSNGR